MVRVHGCHCCCDGCCVSPLIVVMSRLLCVCVCVEGERESLRECQCLCVCLLLLCGRWTKPWTTFVVHVHVHVHNYVQYSVCSMFVVVYHSIRHQLSLIL